MILVDTSIWIELWNGTLGRSLEARELAAFVTCGPVLQEIFQGLRPGAAAEPARQALLALPRLSDPLETRLFLEAAAIYREGRRRGLTIRSSADCLIAAIAIENRARVWHNDRDFAHIAQFAPLLLHAPHL